MSDWFLDIFCTRERFLEMFWSKIGTKRRDCVFFLYSYEDFLFIYSDDIFYIRTNIYKKVATLYLVKFHLLQFY